MRTTGLGVSVVLMIGLAGCANRDNGAAGPETKPVAAKSSAAAPGVAVPLHPRRRSSIKRSAGTAPSMWWPARRRLTR